MILFLIIIIITIIVIYIIIVIMVGSGGMLPRIVSVLFWNGYVRKEIQRYGTNCPKVGGGGSSSPLSPSPCAAPVRLELVRLGYVQLVIRKLKKSSRFWRLRTRNLVANSRVSVAI